MADIPVGLSCSGIYVFVDDGDTYLDRSFVCTSNKGSDVVGTNNLEWVQFGARPAAYKGFGLKLGIANALDVDEAVIPVLSYTQTFSGSNTFTAPVTVNSTITTTGTLTAPRVTNLQTSQITQLTDAVNLDYVTNHMNDSANSLSLKLAARVATTAAITLSTTFSGSVIDNYTLVAGDRVLVKNQDDGAENGLYVVHDTPTVPARTIDMAVGMSVHDSLVAVSTGMLNAYRVFLCTSTAPMDVVGTNILHFQPVAHTLRALAGAGLTGNTVDLQLDVSPDNSTVEVDADTGNVQIKDLGVTNAKIADTTIENGKLVHPQVQMKVLRGLKRSSTDGTTTSSKVTDSTSPADYGQTIALGENVGVEPDFTVVPDLAATNTFTAANTFTGAISVTNTTASTSVSTGALTVAGGVGVTGDIYCNSTYNMSDRRLKDNLVPLDDALDRVTKLNGYSFTWNKGMLSVEGQKSVGLIAQDVQEQAPLCVRHDPDTDLLAVEYSKLVPCPRANILYFVRASIWWNPSSLSSESVMISNYGVRMQRSVRNISTDSEKK